MKIIVDEHEVKIVKNPVNEKEINISKCEFEFVETITDEYVKEAFFTLNGETYKQIITNNECSIPYEVLEENGEVEIGVVAYLLENNEYKKRYNPTPDYIDTLYGSLKDKYDNSEEVTPTDKEQMEQALQDGLNDIAEAIENAENLDIDIEKEDNVTTVTITKQDGTTKSENILDGEKGDKGDKGDKGNDGYTPVKGVDYFTPEDIASLNIPQKTSDLNNDSGFITNAVNNLINYTLKTSTGSLIDLEINGTTYVITLSLKDIDGNVISTDTIDLPLESVVVGGNYDSTNKKIVLTLENGNTVDIPVGDLVAGLQTELSSSNKLNADYIDDTNSGKKLVTTSEKNTWNAKYDKPSGGIPDTDLSSAVQTSLGKADSAVQNTDYATTSKGGVVKIAGETQMYTTSGGLLYTYLLTYAQYTSRTDYAMINKGTLENVITGKGLVSNTDYATANVAGVIRANGVFGVEVASSGTYQGCIFARTVNYSNYQLIGNDYFISKGTLENVITGKDLTTKSYVDGLVGDIGTALDEINGEVVN